MAEDRTGKDPEFGKGERELIDHARRQVERARQRGEETVASPPQDPPAGSATPPPDSFPGYEIVHQIHRGGQGVVYQAIQKGTKRKVAIKVMHEGPFAGPRDKARFEREVQVLGQLNHPNIVAIHDSGTATSGSFYYVMDYISGQPLDVYMASAERSIDETLRLFAKICDAVNAAHLRGVIHRDLKPGNIRIDANGEPRVLDFGLAKIVLGETTDESRPQVMTMTGQFIGSLPWASPEQAEGAPSKIDIRTDVYSLGVILYQMLTGRFPYEVVGNMRDILDNILKTEPAKPSTIRREINNEVETIVLSALAKEPERRYQSAGNLAEDVRRFLRGEPIRAKGDSALYVLRKQLRRHAAPVAVVVAFIAVLAALGIVISIQLEQNRQLDESERIARQNAAAAQARSLYHDANELYWQGSYAQALQKIQQSLALDGSRVDARVRKARIIASVGRETEAIDELERVIDDFPETGAAHAYLAELLREMDPDRAGEHLQRSRQLNLLAAEDYYLQALTIEDPRRAIDLLSHAIDARPGYFDALRLRSGCFFRTQEFDKMLTDTLRACSVRPADPRAAFNVGVAYTGLGLLDDAVREYRRAIELDDRLFKAWFNLAWAFQQNGDLPAARQAYHKAADLEPHDTRPIANLAALCEKQEDYAQALMLYNRLTELDEKNERWPMHAGYVAWQLGNWAGAIAAFEEAVRRNEDDPRANHLLAAVYLTAPDSAGRDAEQGLEIALKVQRLSPSEPHLDNTLALGYLRKGNLQSAIRTVKRPIEEGKGSATDYLVLGMCQILLDERHAATESYEHAVALMRSEDADKDPGTLRLREELENLLQAQQ